jgi:hypothetical protein
LRESETELAVRFDLLVEPGDDQFDRLLEPLGIIDLEDRPSRRDRENRAIDGQGVLAAEGLGEILPQIDALPGLEGDQRRPTISDWSS